MTNASVSPLCNAKIRLARNVTRWLPTLLLCVIAAFALATTALGAEEDFTYSVFNNEATVTGYSGAGGDVTIPSTLGGYPVVGIEMYAFYDRDELTSIIIPDGVISIGANSFYGCTSLESASIPGSVVFIGGWAFHGCTSLRNIAIPDGVISIESSAFGDCAALTSITIPDGVISIYGGAFGGCTSLTSITIPQNVEYIAETAFEGCSSLTNITVEASNSAYSSADGVLFDKNQTKILLYPASKAGEIYSIPNTVNSIDRAAFTDCTSLTSILIPDGVIYIDELAFYGCSSLTNISIPNGITSIGSGTFAHCTSLTDLSIPDGVTSIGGAAFTNCTSLTSIVIPNSVTYIDFWAFMGCTSLSSIIIPDSVTYINSGAFDGCSSLTSITIPSSVETIRSYAFSGCDSLTIYAKFPSKPEGWNAYWNPGNRPVIWTTPVENLFSDVYPKAWYTPAVQYAVDNGLMSGVGDGEFAPNASLTRAMLVTILYSNAGKPNVAGLNNPFTDVPDGQWYTNAIIWAVNNRVVSGIGDGLFGTENKITRQDFAVILWRMRGNPTAGVPPIPDKYDDLGEVADYAKPAVAWAISKGYISGRTDTTIAPTGTATRAEAATLLMKFLKDK
ncbi:MAG: leucine-rich repeat protein [Oscillospiraceae bacterium]|nr:leucine-rich repeat protein [Oscillospiraceae bacterium]